MSCRIIRYDDAAEKKIKCTQKYSLIRRVVLGVVTDATGKFRLTCGYKTYYEIAF